MKTPIHPFQHLILYDGECGLCQRAVRFIYRRDKKKLFAFAPLGGSMAKKVFEFLHQKPPGADSLILIENAFQSHAKMKIEAEAVVRLCWLLGRGWRLIGWLTFLPLKWLNPLYRFVARHRHRLSKKCKPLPTSKQFFS